MMIALFLALGVWVERGHAGAVDGAAHRAATRLASPALDAAMGLGPGFGSATVVVAPLTAAWLLRRRRVGAALLLLASEAGAFVTYAACKGVFARVRPETVTPTATVWDFLFPSGHTVATIVTYGLLAYLIGARLHGRWRVAAHAVAVGIVLFVSVSLVYLDTHYATDVLGGLLLGGAWLILSVVGLRVVETPRSLSLFAPPRDDPGASTGPPLA